MSKKIEVDLDKFLQFTLLQHLDKDDTNYYLSVLTDEEKEKLVRLYIDKDIEEHIKMMASYKLYVDMGAILYKYRRHPFKGNELLKEINSVEGLSEDEIWQVFRSSHAVEPDTGCYLYDIRSRRAIVLVSLHKDFFGNKEWIIEVDDSGTNKKLSEKQKCEVKLEVLKCLEKEGKYNGKQGGI